MSQRLKIARAIMHRPEVLFLDEPTTGLDPNYREILWEQMLALNREGTTIFLTTHYMEEPERFCRHIAIVNGGEIKAFGTSRELKALVPKEAVLSHHEPERAVSDGEGPFNLNDVFVYLTGKGLNADVQ